MKEVSFGRELACRCVWTVWKAEMRASSREMLWVLKEGIVKMLFLSRFVRLVGCGWWLAKWV